MTKTHTMRSRLISLVLVLVMVLGCLPLSAMAVDPPTSSFTQSWGNFEGVRIGASITTGYTLQTVSGSNPIQETKLNLTVLADASIADKTYDYFYIDLQDAEGNTVRRVMWSGFKVAENTPPGGTYEFITAGSVYTQKREDDGTLTRDPSALQPTVSINGKYAYINGVAYTVEGAGTFPVYAQVGYQVSDETAVTLPAQRIGTFNIASYSDDVMTKNLTFNLDATDAYYAYSTVAMVANEDYKLPEVTPIREHYTFKEWKLDDTTTYQPGDTISYTETNKDLMLTAVWELDQVTVNYPDTLPTGVDYDTPAPSDDNVGYGTVQSFDLVLDEGYDPATLFVTANDVLLAPVNYVAGTDGKVTYTYSFTATDDTTIAVSDDLAKLSYVVTMPVGNFDAELVSVNGNDLGDTDSKVSASVIYSKGYTFTVTPEEGYEITGVYVNGDELTANAGVYTVEDVKTAQNVEVLVKEIPNYTVTYVVNNTQYATQVVAKGSEITNMPKSPDVTGYDFEGWYTQDELTGGEGDKILTNTVVNGDMIVYAKLTAKTYTISYNGNGVTIDPSISSEKTYGEPVKLDATVLTRPGYTFLGWSRNQSATEATYAAGDVFTEAITDDITLYAVWKANTYTVTLPTGTGYTVVTTQETVVAWDEDFTFDVVVDRGYVETEPVVKANDAALSANGEPTDGEGGSKVYSYTISNIQENKVVSITVGKNQTYTVTFEAKGRVYQTQQVEYGYCATVPVAPEVEGYFFNGWKLNGTDYVFSTPVTNDITLIADLVWITNPVTLPVDGDGYSVYHEYTPSATNKLYDVGYNQNFAFKVVVKDGYSDANMFVVANGAPLYYNSKTYDETAKTTTYNYTLYNVKTPYEVFVNGVERKTVTITYIDNGGFGGPGQQVANYYVDTATDNSKVPTTEPTRDGYTFQGWAKTNTATADGVVYKAGETGKDTLKETTDTTLYAVWARAEREVILTVEPDEQFEGSEVTLTATVSSGGTGSVLFYRSTDDASNTADDDTLVGTSNVSGDKATATVVVKDYAAGAATDYFYAVFKPTDGAGYTETTSNVVSVTVKSTTIVFGDGDTADDPIVKHWVTGSGLEDVTGGQMVVGETYHLQVPAIYAEDDLVNALDAETVTDIVWQYRLPNGEWQTIVTNDRVSIKVTPDVIGMEYRAILTPKGDYKGEALKTDETKPVKETKTDVALTVAPPEQYEGKDVTLTAAVTTNETIIGEGFVQFYLNGEKIGQPVPVNTQSGVATLTWTTSAYSTATDATNIDVYKAEYLGTATYDAGTSEEASVAVRSTAITWGEDGNILTLQDGTMTAGSTFTLALPAVTTLDGKGTAAYTVQWQEKKAGQDWQNVGAGGETYTVTEYVSGTVYRAVLTPADPYTKAQAYNTNGTEVDGSYVYTLVTADSSEVEEVGTTTGITLYQNNQEVDRDDYVLEGSTVDVVVNVTEIDGYVGGTDGWVKLDVFRTDSVYNTRVDVTSATSQVDNAGNAYFTVVLPAYSYDAVNSNQINFVATFSGDNTFAGSVSGGAGTDNIKLKSAAITWADENGAFAKDVIVYAGTDTTAKPVTVMEANKAYTLVLPDVYAGDVKMSDHSTRIGALLTFGKDYTVQWQRQEVGSATTTGWQDIDGATEASLYVAAEDGAQKYSYRAVVTPKGDYTFAMDEIFGTLTDTKVLTTNPTSDTVLGDTHTTLSVTDTQNFTGINNNQITAEFEKQTVTLTATVKDNDGNLVTSGAVKFYKINGSNDPVEIGHVDVGSDGKAVFEAEMSVYEKDGTYDQYYAVYQTNSVYETSESAKVKIFIRSSAITWNKNPNEEKTLIVTENNAAYTGDLIAGHTYTLTIPAVHELGRYNFTLDVNEDYVINWYMIAADGTQAVAISSGTDGNSVTVKPETNNVVYYAEVLPMEGSNYTKAWENGENGYAYTTHLTTNKTNSALSTATTTTLTIEGSVASTHDAFKHQQYEGKTITLNATITVDGNDTVMVEKGNVSFYVVTESGESTLIGGQSVAVENGKASTTYVLPEYTLDDPLNNVEYFYAVYADYSDELSGELRYSSSNTTTAQDLDALKTTEVPVENRLKIRSIAITWKLNDDYKTMVTNGDVITIYNYLETGDHKGDKTDTMIANTSYVLEVPSVRAYSDLDGAMTILTAGKNYTVQWQYYVTDTASWMNYAADGDSNSVVITPEYSQYSFRAVITPKAQDADINVFTKAAGYENGTVTTLTQASLYTQPTKPTVLKDTTTDLTITGTVAEANDVKIYNGTPFADLDGTEHYTQYEGETVTLKAKVVDADGNLVPSGHVYFYRVEETENSQTHVRLNTEYVEVKNGFAEYTVNIRDYDEDLATIANVDKFYAVYEANDTYNTSASTETTTTATGLVNYEVPTDVADMVYIRSTAIATPRLTSTENGSRDGDDNKKTTTWTSDLAELPAAVKISFSLMRTAGNETEGYSVVGTDGRWLTNGTDYTIQWYREDKTVEDGGEETGSLKAIDGATQVTYTKAAAENFQKYCVEVIAAGHMKTGAMSKQAIIGKTADPVLNLDPGYTFTAADATFATDVETTSGAHYGDEVTLTATVQGDETTNALPTGTVTFYYRVERSDGGYTWTQLTDPIDLQQKDVSENKLVAVATYTFNSSELPFNVDRIGFSYSGDDYYSAYSAASMQTAVTGAEYGKMEFKLWSVQISNPEHEAGEVNPADKNYTDAACYPDGVGYGNVTIEIYTYDENAADFKGSAYTGTDLVANTTYTLEVQDIYTKSGEKLDLAHDNSADYTIEWFKSTDGGLTWGPLPETEYTNIDAKTIAVTPETKDYKYMVKVTTTNSFYNEKMPSLVDFEYSEKNVNTILQTVSVDVQAVAETPVNNVDEWVYQSNPITLFATVTPTNNGEPSGHVEFYYGFAKDGSAEGDYSEVEWTAVKSDTESGTNVAELVKTTSGTDTDGVMVAQLTTSNLPVTADGTYSQLVIKAVYTGDQTYAKQDNINGTVSISSDVVTVFSSKIRQDVENISNKVLTFSGNNWTSTTGVTGDLYDGVIITAKQLVSDGTKTVITLNPVYTLDVIDRADAIFTDLSSIYTLTAGVDYTVEWQYCENYTAYKEYLDDPATNDKNWMTVDNASVSSDFCTVEQVQGYAYRAVIKPCDTEKAQKSFLDNDEIYSNILVVGDAEARVLTNIRKASSASVKGDTVYIDAIIMGGTTTPVGNVTVTVTEKKSGDEVFTDNRNLVNGWTTFQWKNVAAGEYTIKTVLTGNNGYVGETEQDYIVRFTAAPEGDLTMSVTNKTVTYDGQVKMLSGNDVTINGFGDYTEWAEMAKSYVTFQYFDEDGNRVAEPVDAGTYTVKAYLPESMYWGYVTGTGTLTIEKRAVSIADVTAQAKIYDGTNNVYVQNVELELSEQDPSTGLPMGNDGLVEGDSVYVDAKATVAANAGSNQTLTLTSAELEGPDANNYVIANPKYSENFVVSRSQLYGDAVTSITAAPGYQITDDDFYMIDQAGNQITAADATITYYYHTGNDIQKVPNTNGEGKYTVVISMPESNYKGGLTTTLYIQKDVATSRDGDVVKIATSALAYITDTNHVYDGTAKSVTVTTTKGTASVQYAGADGQYTTTAPVNAGRYMVKVTVEGQTYYGVMTIVKGEPQFTFTAETVDYDGDRYNGSLNLVETTGYDVLNADPTYGDLYYTYVGGSIVGYDYNAPRDVSYTVDTYVDSETSGAYGAYMVTAHVPETANTIAVTPSATFEINKIELQVTGDDIYTRLFDTHSKLTSTYDGFVGDEYGKDSELRDLIALPTYQLGDNELLSNEDMSHVGYLEIYQSDVNARNYTLKYVNGDAAINVAPTQDQLEIRNDPSTIYYGDNFQLFLYGSSVRDGDNVVQVNEASAVYWESDHPEIATVDEEGNVNIIGVGQFTITATRGDDPDTAISISETYTALPRRNDVVITRDDYLYDGSAKEIDGANYSFYYMYHGTRFESTDPLSKDLCDTTGEPQIDSGEYPVTAEITGATKNVGDGAGLLAIHRVNSVVTPTQVDAVYGEGYTAQQPGTGYTATTVNGEPVSKVLDKGLVEADVRSNSDVDNYELLVAAGTEGWNYNVTYAPYESGDSHDFTVTQKTLTFTVGSLADTEGMTKNWREKDGTLAGTFKELPDAAFMQNDIRTFGELNQVLDYQTRDLITGDSIADLWDMSSRANANFAKLNDAYLFSVEGAANWKLNKTGEINYEYGTLDHEPMEGAINDDAYIISGYTDSRNYAVTIATGRLDVEQRVVKMTAPTSGIVINGGEYTSEELAEAIANQMVIEGLAEKLDHIIKDLRLTVVGVTGSQTITGGSYTYTLKIGNTNYCTEGGGDTIEVPVTVTNITAKATIYNSGATGFKVRIYGMFDGQTRPEHINELKYTILDRNTGAVVRTGTMTYVKDETVNGILQAVYETSYAQLPNGNYTIRFEAAGYSFSY